MFRIATPQTSQGVQWNDPEAEILSFAASIGLEHFSYRSSTNQESLNLDILSWSPPARRVKCFRSSSKCQWILWSEVQELNLTIDSSQFSTKSLTKGANSEGRQVSTRNDRRQDDTTADIQLMKHKESSHPEIWTLVAWYLQEVCISEPSVRYHLPLSAEMLAFWMHYRTPCWSATGNAVSHPTFINDGTAWGKTCPRK